MLLSRTFGCVRFVWNYTLAERLRLWRQDRRKLSYKDADAQLTVLKRNPEFAWLRQVSCVPLQQTIRHQHRAMQAFFQKRSQYPRFKTRNSRQAATFTQAGMCMRDGLLRIAKSKEPLAFKWSWPDVDVNQLNPTSVTISRDSAGRWFVSFAVVVSDPAALPPTKNHVGVDLGITNLITLSTGAAIANPRHMDAKERRLKKYQRMMVRRQGAKGRPASSRYKKAKLHFARQHTKVADARRDHLHKLTTQLVRDNAAIAIEDLNIRGLLQNRKVAKHIGRSAWYEFRRQLEYKSERYGRQLVVIDRWYPSSKTCSECGHVLSTLPLKTRQWTCPSCGTRHDRDVNAAKNILVAAGLVETQNVRGAIVRPAEATPGHVAVKRESAGKRQRNSQRG